jgi:hypothetical protein
MPLTVLRSLPWRLPLYFEHVHSVYVLSAPEESRE